MENRIMSESIFIDISYAVASIVCIIITAYVLPWIKSKVGNERYNMILEAIDRGVRAAEILFSGREPSGPEKKQYVINYIKIWLETRGLEVSSDELDVLIESTVKNLKLEEN